MGKMLRIMLVMLVSGQYLNGQVNYSTHSVFCTGLNVPNEIVFDTAGILFVANHSYASYSGPFHNTIAKIDPSGNKTVFVSGYTWPSGLAIDNQQNLYFTQNNASTIIRKVTPTGYVTTFASLPHQPGPITLFDNGSSASFAIYTVSHWGIRGIRKTDFTGNQSEFDAGSWLGCEVSADGQYLYAYTPPSPDQMVRFNTASGTSELWVTLIQDYEVWASTIGPDGKLYVIGRSNCDNSKKAIYRINGNNDVTEVINDIPYSSELNDLAFKQNGNNWDIYISEVVGSNRGDPASNRIIKFSNINLSGTFSPVSQNFIFDTKPPVITLINPEGGQSYPATLPLPVSWSASDDYFGATPISVGIKTSPVSGYLTLMENLYNTGAQAVQPPVIGTSTARIRVTVKDYYGNTASDTSDAWFSLTGGGSPTPIHLSSLQNGSPVEGAVIIGYSGSGQYTSIPSGTPGQYLLYLPTGNGYNLRISAPGFQDKEVKNLSIVGGSGLNLYYQMQPSPGFSEYRVVPVTLAPNPALLEIPEGGIGYAWFVAEGLQNGIWLPASNITLGAVDAQGDTIECKTDFLSYNFLSSLYHLQNAGVFSVKIPSSKVGNGMPGAQEIFTVVTAKGVALPAANQQNITAKVVSYTYTTSWDYRIYGKLGLSVGMGLKAGGFAGGGSGSGMTIKLNGLNANPTWSEFQISRRRDIFLGVTFGIGPPEIIPFINMGIENETKRSFPYQTEYSFDMNSLPGLESLLAFYLFYEPTILFAGTQFPPGAYGAVFLSWMVEALLNNNVNNSIGISRIADEAGQDFSNTTSAGISVGFTNPPKPFDLSFGPNLGMNAHLGGSTRVTQNGIMESKLYLTGDYDASFSIGPKFVPYDKASMKLLYPFRLRNSILPTNLGVSFEGKKTYLNNILQSFTLTCGIESNASWLNLNHISGQTQKYSAWLNIDNNYTQNLLDNATELTGEIGNIGRSAVQIAANSNTFSQAASDFLGVIYQEQNNDKPATLRYGYDAEATSGFSIDLDLEIPIPVISGVSLKVGGGLEATHTTAYNIGEGYWLKGYPYLQKEMPNPPNPLVTFVQVMTTLWGHVTSGQTLTELANVIGNKVLKKLIGWDNKKTLTQVVPLNPEGSRLTINPLSLPAGVDSVTCHHYEWEESNTGDNIGNPELKAKMHRYVRTVRSLRQAASGLTFGIGGFYAFEPKGNVFGDSTLITIAYPDSVVTGLDETKLAVYWEDTLGIWHYISSATMPDSNKVSAYIHQFTTYTLAPILPQGEYGFDLAPDSIPANGFSTAMALSDMMYNSDGTLISDNILFTVSASRGSILSYDADPSAEGIQVPSLGGRIYFMVKADTIANPVVLIARSIEGYATASDSLPLYDLVQPAIPVITGAIPVDGAILLQWNPVAASDIAGYLVYFDTDTITPPYNGTANVWGSASPVSVGMTTSHRIAGLNNSETYFISLRAFDIRGNMSGYATPVPVSLIPPLTTLTVDGDTLFDGQSECFNATDTLRTGGIGGGFVINSGGEALLIAGKLISMLPGTNVQAGGYLHASITENEQFCSRIGQTGIPPLQEVRNEQILNGNNRCFNATGTLLVAGNGNNVQIFEGGNATFIVGHSIRFLPGLTADSGGYMLGKITPDGQYCNYSGDHFTDEQLLYDHEMPTVSGKDNFFRLYPNPAGREVTLSLFAATPETQTDITFHNLLGHEIFRERIYGSSATFSVQSLKAGIYLVKVNTEGHTGTAKLVKL